MDAAHRKDLNLSPYQTANLQAPKTDQPDGQSPSSSEASTLPQNELPPRTKITASLQATSPLTHGGQAGAIPVGPWSLTVPAKTESTPHRKITGEGWQAINPSGARMPIGVPAEAVDVAARVFQSDDPNLQKVEALILSGSRFHFDAGHQPKPDSDVDMMAFTNGEDDPLSLERFDITDTLNAHMQAAATEAGVQIEEEFPAGTTLALALSDNPPKESPFTTYSRMDELVAWQDITSAPEYPTMSRNKIKKAFTKNLLDHGGLLSKDVLIILREDKAETYASKLQALDYTNLVVAS